MKVNKAFLNVTLMLCGATPFLASCGADRVAAPPSRAVVLNAARSGGSGGGGGGSGSGRSTGDGPHFLEADPTALTIANPVIAFWAKKGLDQSVRMVYHARPGHNDSTTFLVFRVRDRSLVSRVDGTPLADGDSILITLTLVDPIQLVVDFQPAGLRFSTSHPPSLKMVYADADQDFNGDGVIDSRDAAIAQTFQIWRRETLADPWIPLPSVVVREAGEVTADIGGFTGYAIAY
jgi:hypothetical protein